ncbi:FIG139612: Possible conserved membrane protein [hydrothermal vent metagenome]|uniref:FIG139612: Possible conserved membrane protein n=1 Tax=hydrothermal vent metagenome TaxID=652676 RepID=A0A3B0TVQ1_9ZZZZ
MGRPPRKKTGLPRSLSSLSLSSLSAASGAQGASALDFETEAESLASGLPALLLDAERVANAVALGVHGRRRPGMGESFWQFRRYRDGDTPASIDWRRSARSHKLYVRDNEWEAAATVWLWLNRHPTMAFRSPLATGTKAARAIVLLLALGSLLVRGGERIGAFGSGAPPRAGRQAVPRIAEASTEGGLTAADAPRLPPDIETTRFSTLVVFSDFLDPIEQTVARLSSLAARGLKGHLVQVLDPAEETFPYQGRHEFTEIAGGGRLIVGRAEGLASAYRARLEDHRAGMRQLARRLGWTFTLHHTDHSPSQALLALYSLMMGETALPMPRNPARPAKGSGDGQQAAG